MELWPSEVVNVDCIVMTAVSAVTPSAESPLLIDRYAIYDAIAAGGMATVHLGRLVGPHGFLRTVAVKRLHAQYAHDAEFTGMLLDEARVAARIQHPNVVSTLDVVVAGHELLLVMDYVRGESLARLCRRAQQTDARPPPRIVVSVVHGTLQGLHAAHEATNEKGQPLGLIHRDVSPQNVLVGIDGIPRVLDFGIAKAEGRVSTTQDGKIKGKILYMSPEQLAADNLTRTADIYAAGVLLFEALTNVRMFAGENEGAALSKIIRGEIRVPSEVDPGLARFDDVVRRATRLRPEDRFATAADMAEALLDVESPATSSQVAAWVQELAGDVLEERARVVAEIERSSTRSKPPVALPTPPASGSLPSVPEMAGTAAIDGGPPSARNVQPSWTSPDASASHFLRPAETGVNVGMVLAGGLAVAFLGALIVIGALVFTKRKDTVAPVASDRVVVPILHVGPATESPTGSVGSAGAPTQSSSAPSPPPVVSAVATVPTSTASVVVPPKQIYVRPPVNCEPPYTIDKSGRKHFIPECFK